MSARLPSLSGKQIAAGALCVYLGACAMLSAQRAAEPRASRGLKFSHQAHAELVDCSTCHGFGEDAPVIGHELCSVCHEIPMDAPTVEACAYCHDREDYTLDARTPRLAAELIFDHTPHAGAALECATCHENPDLKPLPTGPLKSFCMDCHARHEPALNECAVCHREISQSAIPVSRLGRPIAHDEPGVWRAVHGREAVADAAFCNLCHTEQEDCMTCHRIEPPRDHTVSFRRHTHGMKAVWDRQSCSVCHEEDSCLKCHQNTAPRNHNNGFGPPRDGHCVQCHFPAENTNCTVCHEEIRHRSAKPSIHALGIYPANCNLRHPGGLPTRAPHLLNSTVRCIVCHQ